MQTTCSLFDISCLDDLLAGRALPLLYALFNVEQDSQGWALLAALLGVAFALALSVWRTERMFTPSPFITGLDAALCIVANATLLFHKAHRLDRDSGVSLCIIPLYVSIILLSEIECADRLRYIVLASVVLVMLPMLVFFSIAASEDSPPPNIAPPSSLWTYLFICLTSAYAASSPCLHIQGVAVRGAILMAIATLSTHSLASLIIDQVGHGALFTTQMALVVMPSTFIHAKTLRSMLESTRSLMLAIAVVLAAAYDSPVRFHAPAVHQQCSWAVAALVAAAAVDAALP